jgi:hypothetical protein
MSLHSCGNHDLFPSFRTISFLILTRFRHHCTKLFYKNKHWINMFNSRFTVLHRVWGRDQIRQMVSPMDRLRIRVSRNKDVLPFTQCIKHPMKTCPDKEKSTLCQMSKLKFNPLCQELWRWNASKSLFYLSKPWHEIGKLNDSANKIVDLLLCSSAGVQTTYSSRDDASWRNSCSLSGWYCTQYSWPYCSLTSGFLTLKS